MGRKCIPFFWVGLIGLIALGISTRCAAQQQVHVIVVDSLSNGMLPGVSVYVDDALGGITGASGDVWLAVPHKSVGIRCEKTGYHAFLTTYVPDRTRSMYVKLCPEMLHLHEVSVRDTLGQSRTPDFFSGKTIGSKGLDQTRSVTFGELMSRLPGVTLLGSGPSIQKPVIHGLQGPRIVIMQNGVKLEGQSWGNDHAPEMDPLAVQQITVIKGAAGILYGPEALGGVVLSEPIPYLTSHGQRLDAALLGASNGGLGALHMAWLGKGKKGTAWRITGTLMNAGDGRSASYGLMNTGFRNGHIAAGLHWDGKHSHSEVQFTSFNGIMGIFKGAHVHTIADFQRAINAPEPLYQRPFSYQIGYPRQEVHHHMVAFRHHITLKNKWEWRSTAALQWNRRMEFDGGLGSSLNGNPYPAIDLTLITGSYWGQFEKSFRVIGHPLNVITGVQAQYQRNVASGRSFLIPNYSAEGAGLFGLITFRKWTLGARMDSRVLQVSDWINHVWVDKKHTWTQPSGWISWKHAGLKAGAWLLSAGYSWRPPSPNELYASGVHGATATFEKGVSRLSAEKLLNAQLEWTLNRQGYEWQVLTYINQAWQFISPKPELTPTVTIRGAFPTLSFQQVNARILGLDFHAAGPLKKQLKWTIDGSYLYAEDRTHHQPLFLMPAPRAALGLQWVKQQWGKLYDVQVEVRYARVAQQWRYVPGFDYINPPKGYGTFEVGLSGSNIRGQHVYRWSLSVRNALNAAYRDYQSLFRYYTNDPGWNVVLRINLPGIYRS